MTAANVKPGRVTHANDHVVDRVQLAHLRESKTNPRRMFDQKALEELAASIKAVGLAQPLLVRKLEKKGGDQLFEVVAGARRFRAAKLAGLLEVPVFVREMTEVEAIEFQLVENQQRADVHPLDEGVAFRELVDRKVHTPDSLAGKLGRSARWVYSRMALAKLPAKVQALYLEKKLELSVAQLLTTVAPELQEKAAREIAKGDRYGDEGGQPMRFRAAKRFVDRHFRCELKGATFEQGQKDLLPELEQKKLTGGHCGACGSCPHNTANGRTLFDQVDEDKGPALCMQPACFDAKTAAAEKIRAARVIEKGGKVVEGRKFANGDVRAAGVNVDERCELDPKGRSWRQLLGKNLPPVTLVTAHESQYGQRYPETQRVHENLLRKALQDAGHGKLLAKAKPNLAPRDPYAAEQRRKQKAHRARMEALAGELPNIGERAEKLDAAHAWALVVRHLVLDRCHDGAAKVEKRRGIKLRGKAEALLEMKAAQLQGIALEAIAAHNPSYSYGDRYDEATLAIAKACKVDLGKAVRAIVAKAKKPAKGKAAKKPRAKK